MIALRYKVTVDRKCLQFFCASGLKEYEISPLHFVLVEMTMLGMRCAYYVPERVRAGRFFDAACGLAQNDIRAAGKERDFSTALEMTNGGCGVPVGIGLFWRHQGTVLTVHEMWTVAEPSPVSARRGRSFG